MEYCSSCAQPVADEARFCGYCGEAMSTSVERGDSPAVLREGGVPRNEGRWYLLQHRYVWATVAIALMWGAVALVGVFGPKLEVNTAGGDRVDFPLLALSVGFFAVIASVVVAIRGFRD